MVCCALRGGFHLFLVEAWDPQQSPLDMAAEGCTMLGSALPFFLAFLAAQKAHGDEPLYPRLRTVSSGGAPKPPGIHEEIRDHLGGAGVLGSWGLTEFPVATGAAPGDPDDMLALTEGRPGPGVDLKVVALDGHECGELEEGELRLRGPQTFLGYANPALATTGVDDEGFVCTGDLGVVHPGGFVQITGRVKDIIIRNAENISATEIEEHLFEHPAIHDVAVIGVPDPRTGERAVAVVQLAAGYDTLTLPDLAEFCIGRGLAKWKIPEQIEIVDAIPRNGMGKIEKPALRKRYADSPRPS
jgi:acyl-CoA synthetase (AMP-forming)/AMP-acid ligase II